MQPVNTLNNGEVIVMQGTDENLVVRFFHEAIPDKVKSKHEGRPIFRNVEMVEILTPGSRDRPTFLAEEKYIRRFPRQYENFKSKSEKREDGTPLEHIPFISASERKELEYFNVFTAEQLVGMADGNLDRVGNDTRSLVKKVKAYMESAKDNSVVPRLVEENDKLKKEMALLQEQMNEILKDREVKDVQRKDDGNDGNEVSKKNGKKDAAQKR